MSMPIQRQSEQFSVFDTGTRWERDRPQHDLPKGLAGLVNSMGPRVQGGMLNTRTAGWFEEDPDLPPRLREVGLVPGGGVPHHEELAELDREHREREFPHGDYTGDIYPSDDDHDGSYWPGKHGSRTAADSRWVDSKDGSGRKKCKNCGGVGYGSCVCKDCDKCGSSYYGSCDCGGSKREAGWNYPEFDRTDIDYDYDHDLDKPDAAELADIERDMERDRARRLEEQNYLRHLDRNDPSRHIPGDYVDPREARLGSGRHPFDRAAARRLTAFQWQRHIDAPDLESHKAKLENGHELHAWQVRGPEGDGDGWHWAISNPGNISDDELSEWSHPEELGHMAVAGRNAGWVSDGGTVVHDDYIYSLDDAKQQAQEHYKTLFPIGSDTGPHDSGVDYSDLNRFLRESARLAAKCTCWEGYERVPGTEPCSEDSCRKESMRLAGAGIDDRDVRPGPLVDSPLYEQDPDDYFGRRPYKGAHCPDCGKPMPWVSGPTCRHGNLLVDAGFLNGRPDHSDVSWQETADGWEHPVTGCRVQASEKFPGEWEMVAPTTSKRRPYSIIDHHTDPHAMMARHDRTTGYAPRTAQMSYEDAMKYIDDALKGGEPVTHDAIKDFDRWHQNQHPSSLEGASGADVFEMYHDYLGPERFDRVFGDGDHRDDFYDHLTQRFGHRHAAAPAQDPAAMAPQIPAGGGFQPAHRVGLPWRDSVIPGTVIGVDGPNVAVRWDDGQYSTEEPHNIQLL